MHISRILCIIIFVIFIVVIVILLNLYKDKSKEIYVIHHYESINTNYDSSEFCNKTNWDGCFRHTNKNITFFNPSIYDSTYKTIKVAPFNFCNPNRLIWPSDKDHEEDYKVVLMKNDEPIYVISRAEDGRLIKCQERLICIYTAPFFTNPTTSIMHMFDFSTNKKWKLKYDKAAPMEKNWSPFVYNNELYLSYKLSPHNVLKCDINTGTCTEMYLSNSKLPSNIRGSSQIIPWKNNYIGIAHTTTTTGVLERTYIHYIFIMNENPPFEIVRSSIPFTFPTHFNDWRDKIQFCCGLFIKDKYFYISYGVADCLSFILKVHETEIEHLLNGTKDTLDITSNSLINYDNLNLNSKK